MVDLESSLDALTRPLDPAMVIVTTATDDGGERSGCLVGFHAQSSISPRRYAFWLSKANHTYGVAVRASTFAVHFLAVGDLPLARRFGEETGDEVDKFEGLAVSLSADGGGVPVLDALPHHVVVRKVAMLDDGGDHVCITTEPLSASSGGGGGAFVPLRLHDVAGLEPGHDA